MGNGGKRKREEVPKQEEVPVKNQTDLDQVEKGASTVTQDAGGNEEPLPKRRKTLLARFQATTAAVDYIRKNASDLRGKFSEQVREVTKQLDQKRALLDAAIKSAEAQLTKEKQFASRTVAPLRPGQGAGDWSCYVQFVNVGAGDCTLVVSPLGKRIMIDCGSDSLSDVLLDPRRTPDTDPRRELLAIQSHIRSAITSRSFLGRVRKIDLLFLTHPDSDHHSLVAPLLAPLNVNVGYVYYGGTDDFATYQATARYLNGVAGTADGTMRKVTLREEAVKSDADEIVVTKQVAGRKVEDTQGKAGKLADEWAAANGSIVAYYENTDGSDFKISLLAGNVTGVWRRDEFVTDDTKIKVAGEPRGDGTAPNKRCLMVLVECYGEKILVCGDATAVTERFALDYFPQLLVRVTTLRVAHHGSQTSSSQAFLNRLRMRLAVVSTSGKNTVGHFLPKRPVLALYPPKLRAGVNQHSIYAFDRDDLISHLYIKDTTVPLWATGSNDSYPLILPKPK